MRSIESIDDSTMWSESDLLQQGILEDSACGAVWQCVWKELKQCKHVFSQSPTQSNQVSFCTLGYI